MRFKIVLLLGLAGIALSVFYGTRFMRVREYRKIAQTNCGTCHLFPEPNLLDKSTWINGVMPEMAERMGRWTSTSDYSSTSALTGPQRSMVSDRDWEKIMAYYYHAAPEKPLPQRHPLKLDVNLSGFKPIVLRAKVGHLPKVSMLKFLPKTGQLLVGTYLGGLFRYNLKKDFRPQDSLFVHSAPSWAGIADDGKLEVLAMGQITPNDNPSGRLIGVKEDQQGRFFAEPKIGNLKRPVHFSKADLNDDGKADYLICQFGHLAGKLSLHLSQDTGYVEKVLKSMPGTRITYCVDLDGDQKKDILALMTQGDEKIVWFQNKGKGEFEERELLRFPPVYGSSYLELKDMNGDGLPDLIHSSGDNLDYSYSLKRFHGIRIFLNRGKGKFEEQLFLPQHGVGIVLAEDFDQDGDQDLATVAYFPDYEGNPNEAFVYYENLGNLKYKPHSFPGAKKGKWLVMEKGDFDGDGDVDLAIGALTMNNGEKMPAIAWKRFSGEGVEVILLMNQLKK